MGVRGIKALLRLQVDWRARGAGHINFGFGPNRAQPFSVGSTVRNLAWGRQCFQVVAVTVEASAQLRRQNWRLSKTVDEIDLAGRRAEP